MERSENEDRENSVYLDTTVLSNWLRLYRKPKRTRELAEKKAKACMNLLDNIVEKRYNCTFLASEYALSEISQTARDNVIALKIIKDEFSLNWFNWLKKRYSLETGEQREILATIEAFKRHLARNGLRQIKTEVGSHEVSAV